MQLALRYQQAGRLAEAEALYRQVLEVQPNHAPAMHMFGLVAHKTGRNDCALEWVRRSIAIEPESPEAHCNLGAILRALGRPTEAIASYQRAIELRPAFALPHYGLGLVLAESERLAEAAAEYQKAVQLNPTFAEAHNNLGAVLREIGRQEEAADHFHTALRLKPENPAALVNLGVHWTDNGEFSEAVAAFQQALALRPDYAEAHNNLGIALRQSGRIDDAMASFYRALQIRPDFADAHNNLGEALAERGQPDEAIAAYRRALECKKEYPEAHNNLGNVLANVGRVDDALAALRQALALRPNYVDAWANLGGVLTEQGNFNEADDAFRRALEIDPHCANARANYSFLLLLRGDFARGWPMYESRETWIGRSQRPDSGQKWDGAEMCGKRVLVRAEQGLGDAIHFVRYMELVAARGGQVILECEPVLAEIFRGARGVHEVLPKGQPLPASDFQVLQISLPLIFRTTAESIPRNVPYLFADPDRRDEWRKRFPKERSRYRVGLVWAGSPQHRRRRNRDVPLEKLRTLLATENVDFYSIQLGPPAADLQKGPGTPAVIDHTGHIRDFADTAALIMELDLIISVDTAVAHLAGALGRQVWTLLPAVPDWRWGLESETTPRFPTMRLFRQLRSGDWDSVIARVEAELRRVVEKRQDI
jgi:tetratricopeptide (TPR) repeat protein